MERAGRPLWSARPRTLSEEVMSEQGPEWRKGPGGGLAAARQAKEAPSLSARSGEGLGASVKGQKQGVNLET